MADIQVIRTRVTTTAAADEASADRSPGVVRCAFVSGPSAGARSRRNDVGPHVTNPAQASLN